MVCVSAVGVVICYTGHSERGRANTEIPYSGISGISVSVLTHFLYEFRYRIPIPDSGIFGAGRYRYPSLLATPDWYDVGPLRRAFSAIHG